MMKSPVLNWLSQTKILDLGNMLLLVHKVDRKDNDCVGNVREDNLVAFEKSFQSTIFLC